MNERQTRLEQINAQLKDRGLKQLRKLGDVTQGEFEVLRIIEIHDHSKRFFTDVKFAVALPGGKEGEFTVRFNANGQVSDGAVIVVLVNGLYAIVKQWRLPLAQWTYEVPRGFGDKIDNAHIAGNLGTIQIGDLPLGTVSRELGEEVMKTCQITSVTHLGNVAENSGTNNVAPSYFLVQLQVDEAQLQAKLQGSESELLKVLLWSQAEVDRQIGQRIADNHSIVALSLASRYIARLPRSKRSKR